MFPPSCGILSDRCTFRIKNREKAPCGIRIRSHHFFFSSVFHNRFLIRYFRGYVFPPDLLSGKSQLQSLPRKPCMKYHMQGGYLQEMELLFPVNHLHRKIFHENLVARSKKIALDIHLQNLCRRADNKFGCIFFPFVRAPLV